MTCIVMWPVALRLPVCCNCPVAPLGDFCTDLSCGKDFVSCTCCACLAAPLGNFCTDLSCGKDFVSCTCCACPAAPLDDFCTELSFSKRLRIVHLLCLSGCTLMRLFAWSCLLVKDFVSCTCCACPVAPLGDFCMDFVAREGSLRYLSR
jgi:hypothetical protein